MDTMDIEIYPWASMVIFSYYMATRMDVQKTWMPGNPWISIDIHGYPRVTIDIHGYSLLHRATDDINGYPWIWNDMGTHGCLWCQL